MTTPPSQKTRFTSRINVGAAANHVTSAVKTDKITKLKIKHAITALSGKDGSGGSRVKSGYTTRMDAINQLERIGMDSISAAIRKSVNEGLLLGVSDLAEPVSAAATKAMENIKQ